MALESHPTEWWSSYLPGYKGSGLSTIPFGAPKLIGAGALIRPNNTRK